MESSPSATGSSLNLQGSLFLWASCKVAYEEFPIAVRKHNKFVPESFHVMLCCLALKSFASSENQRKGKFMKLLGASVDGHLLLAQDLLQAHHRGRIQFHFRSIPVGFCGGGFWVEKFLQIKLILSSGISNHGWDILSLFESFSTCHSETNKHALKAYAWLAVHRRQHLKRKFLK